MPLYDYNCKSCGAEFDEFKPMRESTSPANCPKCGQQAEKVLSAPRVIGDYPGYSCPVTGKWIEGRAAHRENLKQTGCRVFEPGEKEAAARFRARQEAETDAAIEETVGREIAAMPADKLEALGSALENNFEAKVVRQ